MNQAAQAATVASVLVWTLGSVLVVSLVSLVGVLALMAKSLLRHRVVMFLVALAAGTLVGDAFLHLLPEAAHDGFNAQIGWFVILGFLAMFLLEGGLRLQHGHVEAVEAEHHPEGHIAPFGILNLVGDAVHNLLDGVVVAAAYLISIPVGIATTIAVAAHEVPQELGDFAILVRAGMHPAKALLFNLGSALFAFLGAAAVLVAGLSPDAVEGIAVPLVAGAFLYIAAADLVPELHHHARGREAILILVGLLAGLLLMGFLLDLEALMPGEGHAHD